MNRKNLIWTVIILLVILVTSVGLYYVFNVQARGQGESASTSENSTQTAVARRGDLIIFASGTGQLVPLDETTLAFDENGTLVELLVRVGDPVAEGDLLAQLRVNKSDTELAADIAKAELTVLENQQTLDALYAEAEIAAAQALYDLETAQQELANLQDNETELAQAMQSVVEAEEAIENAEMKLYIYNSTPSEEDIYTAYASLLFKEKKYNERQAEVADLEYEHKTASSKDMRQRIADQLDRAKAQMYNAQIAYEDALYRYETIDDPADTLDLSLAQAQLNTAQAQLDQANLALAEAQQGAPAGDIALAEAQVAEAQAEWEGWQNGPDPEDIVLAETRLKASQLSLQLAEQESLIVDLIAPLDGTVMEVNAAINEYIAGDQIISLANTSQLLVEVSLDESDFISAQIGNRVEVIFDALPDRTFSGSIVKVLPGLERNFGSQVIKALAVLDQGVYGTPLALPVGLTASVDVIAGEASNAVLVPIEALHQSSAGDDIVYVQVNQAFEPREVAVGLMDFTSAEIISGLEPGEIVAVGDIE